MTFELHMATSADGLSGSMGQGEGEKRFLLLYGSQTGQSQAIAEQLRDLACERGLEPDIHCISQSEKKVLFQLESEKGQSESVRALSFFRLV